jgi:hypothetical protein
MSYAGEHAVAAIAAASLRNGLRSCGNVTCQNWPTLPAPSIDAASYNWSGIACSPASRITIWNPNPCQIERIMMAGRASLPCFDGRWRPPSPEKWHGNCTPCAMLSFSFPRKTYGRTLKSRREFGAVGVGRVGAESIDPLGMWGLSSTECFSSSPRCCSCPTPFRPWRAGANSTESLP